MNINKNCLEVPNKILRIDSLTLGDKFMFGFIQQIISSNHNNFCMTNKEIAEKLNIRSVVASRNLGHLLYQHYICSKIVGRNNNQYSGVKRIITITKKGKGYINGYYQRIPNIIIKSNLSLSKQLLLGYAYTYHIRLKPFFESNSSVAHHLNIDISSVRRGFKSLIKHHYLYKILPTKTNSRRYLILTNSFMRKIKKDNKYLIHNHREFNDKYENKQKLTNNIVLNLYKKCNKSIKRILNEIDSLTGRQFEFCTGKLFRLLGFYNVKVTPASGDYGIDVIATDPSGFEIGIQCKHHKSENEKVGYKAVEEACGGIKYYQLNMPIVLTNQSYTPNAINGAKYCHVKLLGRKWLLHTLIRMPESKEKKLRYEIRYIMIKSKSNSKSSSDKCLEIPNNVIKTPLSLVNLIYNNKY